MPETYWGDYRSFGGAGYAPFQAQHEPQIQHDVQNGGNRQKQQGRQRIAHRPQQGGEVVVKKRGRDAEKDDKDVFPHRRHHVFRHPEKDQNPVQTGKNRQVQNQSQDGDQEKGSAHAFF